jgi:predicted RNA binding protein YcfA (HicA-like mRNA interferase family)
VVEGYYRAVRKLIVELGFEQISGGKGSHEKWMNPEGRVLIVPRNLMSRHTANNILKDAGIPKKL